MASLTLDNIKGTWYIKVSNFPMWKDESRKDPSFNYSIINKNNKEILLDEVKFTKNGKAKTIVGYDYPLNKENTQFLWKGKGVLFLFASRWEISWINDSLDIAIIRFTKTLFTPAGFDIICRNPEISKEGLSIALEQLNKVEQESLFYVS